MTNVPSTKETTKALVALADAVEMLSVEWGIRYPLPPDLIAAAERIVLAARAPMNENLARNASVGQLIMWCAGQDEDVTAPLLSKRISELKSGVSTKSVSVALHRAAERGQFQRKERGVYRLSLTVPFAFDRKQPTVTSVSKGALRNGSAPEVMGDGGRDAAGVDQEVAMS